MQVRVMALGEVPMRTCHLERRRAPRNAEYGVRIERASGVHRADSTAPGGGSTGQSAGRYRSRLHGPMSDRRPLLMLIDGPSLVYRGYFALPPLTMSDGTLVNAVFGFLQIVLRGMQDVKP